MITDAEGLIADRAVLDLLIAYSEGDLRRAITCMECASRTKNLYETKPANQVRVVEETHHSLESG
jgi:replication-associated recombination protein RarA